MNTNTAIFSCALTLGLSLGFVPADRSQPAPADQADVTHAHVLADATHEGLESNGISLDGSDPLGFGLGPGGLIPVGGELGGASLIDLKVANSGFAATMEVDDELVEVTGADLVGARLRLDRKIIMVGGDAILEPMRAVLVGVEQLGGSTLAHHMVVYDAATSTWKDPCADNGGLGLIPLQGAWDLETGDALGGDQVTLACRGSVLAKCVEWGYEPWRSPEMADLHQACTRMARADYCGDGTPHTVDGTKIDVYDAYGVQQKVTHWPVEAEWGPEGATCIGGDVLRLGLLGIDKPDCLADLYAPQCGDLKGDSLLANRYPG